MTLHEFDDYSERFLAFRFRGDVTAANFYTHRRMLHRFRDVLFPEAYSEADLESDVTILKLDRWIRVNLSPSSQMWAIRVLKRFSRWLLGSGVIRFAWASDLPATKGSRPKLRPMITGPQFEKLKIEALGTWYYWPIVLSWYTGLAMNDACCLRWREVDMEACMIRKHRRKTGASCTVPFQRGGELHKMLLMRLRLRRVSPQPRLDGEDDDPQNDFVDYESGMRVKPENGRIDHSTTSTAIKDLMRKSGISTANASMHSLRVSFCSRMANSDVNIAVAMAMTGHKSVGQFQRYVRPTEEALRRGLERAFGNGENT